MRTLLPRRPMDILVLLVCCLATGITAEDGKKRTHPPRIVRHPPKEIAYKVGDSVGGRVELPCVASAEPQPTYSWKKDGAPLNVTGLDIKKQPGTGTLVIEEPLENHEGVYQCFASNSFGTAVSLKTMLKRAVLEPFDTVAEPKEHHVDVGSSLTLRCSPPESYPSGAVYWGETTANNKFQPLMNDARVAQDYKGNLYYANVITSDSHGGATYVCVVYNSVIRSLVQGDDSKIVPRRGPATPPYRAPKLMWHSETPTIAIRSQRKTMKCIFEGYPTPVVHWSRVDGDMLDKNYETSSGQELTLPNIEYDDAGHYRCSATNVDTGSPISKDFHLTVESMPFWVTEPEDVNSAEEENAEFTCEAGGVPKPNVEWYMNGRPLDEFQRDSRRVLKGNALSFTNLTKTDAQVIQCNATNKHGYIFANAYLNVAAEPPTWEQHPEAVVKVAEGQQVDLTCRVYGAPKPKITWTYERLQINDTKFSVVKSGDLHIDFVTQADEGNYQCHAVNKFGKISGEGALFVRRRTVIEKSPESQVVNATSTVVFECSAETDSQEEENLRIYWKFRGKEVILGKDPRIRMNTEDHSLKIIGVEVRDTGDYTCVADNGLDADEATATLSVQDKPNPPQNVRLTICSTSTAEVAWDWDPNSENNNEVIDFTVYYNTSFDEPEKFHKGPTVPRGETSARIELSPWSNYTFHVRARNSLGSSDRSEATPAFCTTQADIPHRNPNDVCTESRNPDQLVIVWKPMPRIDHNGEGFHYIVSYKEHDVVGAVEHIQRIKDWKKGEYVVDGVQTFQKYEIYVQAVNDEGTSPSNKLRRRFGFSGEGVPMDTPENFAVDEDTINSTSAVFTWERVEETPERVLGHFRGYQIRFWKSDNPDEVRSHDVLYGHYDPCPIMRGGRRRNRRQAGEEGTGHVRDLWPFSRITAGVLVINGGKSGALSDTIEFDTPEGVPGIILNFDVREVGSHHFGLYWSPPTEPNGILTGYVVGYQKADGSNDIQYKEVPRHKLNTKVTNLEPETPYRLYLWATTAVGKGVRQVAEETTKAGGVPDVPGFNVIIPGDDHMNVSWVPTGEGPSENPGSAFYVEYRKKGDDDWSQSHTEDEEDTIHVDDLDPYADYEVRIVAVNGAGEESRSPIKTIKLGATEEAITQEITTAGWFVGMMCAIVFLLLILIIICLIKRNRGGKYPVHEKEKLRGHDPDKEDEEGGFGEYTKTDEPDYKKSQGSLESETKPLGESDTDSMAEYGDVDPSKFNEDGSFIGQYGGKKTKPEEKMEPDATSPNALSTFV